MYLNPKRTTFSLFFVHILQHHGGGEKSSECSGSFQGVRSDSLGLSDGGEGGGGAPPSNPAGPHIAYGSSLRLGRSPSIAPGTSSTRMTPGGGKGGKNSRSESVYAAGTNFLKYSE